MLHPFATPHTSAAPAVLAPHQVPDLTLDPGPHFSILLLPGVVALTLAMTIERLVFRVQLDGAACFRLRALGSLWTLGAVLAELCDSRAVLQHAQPA